MVPGVGVLNSPTVTRLAATAPTPPGDAWALYLMDEGAGQTLYDSSGNNRDMWLGFDGTVETSDPAWVILNGVTCLEFAGAQGCRRKTDVALAQPFTIVALVRMLSASVQMCIVSRGINVATGLLRYETAATRLTLFLPTLLYDESIPVNAWSACIGVANGASSAVWQLGGTVTTGDAGTNNLGQFSIGGRAMTGSYYNPGWRGQIAAVAIIQGALSVSVAEQWATYLKAVKGVA